MTRHVIAGHFGASDDPAAHATGADQLARLDLLDGQRTLRHGIGGALRTLREHGVFPTEVGIDLAVIAAHVHAADTRVSREQTSQDAWTREIGLVVPVSDLASWNRAAPVLDGMLRFLTGDLWNVTFRPRPPGFEDFVRRPMDVGTSPAFDGVALFSGGLDSLIGAVDTLHEGQRPLFVSHAGEGAVSRPQRDLFDGLAEVTRKRSLNAPLVSRLRVAMAFRRGLVAGVGGESSTRGRSFLFIALAACAGSGLGGAFRLFVPENGLIALNVPLDPTRLGSLSTRTTHPYYLHRWSELLGLIGIPGTVTNLYWHRTKGEMVAECKDPGLLRSLAGTSMSCAHPATARYHGGGPAHCGTCVPCLIRRAAFSRAWGPDADPTGYRVADLETASLDAGRADGVQIRAFQYAIARLRSHPDLARQLIHKPGPLTEDHGNLDALAGVYARGLDEVGHLLQRVRTHALEAPGGL